MKRLDLSQQSVRDLNQLLHDQTENSDEHFEVLNAKGAHALACGINSNVEVTIKDHVGYYCAGMHQRGQVTVQGNAGVGVAENMMSGMVRVQGNASQSAGATAHGFATSVAPAPPPSSAAAFL